jgi:hypothetical protein
VRVGFLVLGVLAVACSTGGGATALSSPSLGSAGTDASADASTTHDGGDDDDDADGDSSDGGVETGGTPGPGCNNGVVEPGELCLFEPLYTDGIPGALSITVDDFDGDTHDDLAVLAAMQGAVYVLFGGGDGNFLFDQYYDVGSEPVAVVAGAFDALTLPDLVTTNGGDGSLSVLVNTGIGEFGAAPVVTVPTAPTLVAAADFNNDGLSDLALAHGDAMGRVSILLGSGTGLVAASELVLAGGDALGLAAADVDGNGLLDLVVGIGGVNEVAILGGDGLGAFAETTRVPSGGEYPIAIGTADLDGDGSPEILVGNGFPDEVVLGNLQVVDHDGTSWFAKQLVLTEGAGALDFGDFDADGDDDVVLTTRAGGSVQVFINDGAAALGPPETFPLAAPAEPFGVVAADFDDNGAWDIAVADPLGNRIAIFVARP